MFRMSLTKAALGAFLAAAPITAASAHPGVAPHSHPHLIVGNELLTGFLVLGVAVVIYAARLLSERRRSPSKTARRRR